MPAGSTTEAGMKVIHCKLCDDLHFEDMRECPCCCGGCGGDLDSTGSCRCGCAADDTVPPPAVVEELEPSPG